jgi:adenosylcobyric acid synthase
VCLTWARTPAELAGADWIVLPGSKHTSGDLAWLRAQGLDEAIRRHAGAGRPLLGVCGGLQMLGRALHDPHGVDGAAAGLDLLPVETTFGVEKLLRPGRVCFDALDAPWAALSGVAFDGYEIRHGRTLALGECDVALRNADGEAIGWQRGNVLGVYAHGLFESADVLKALFAVSVPSLDEVFDGLADYVDQHFEAGVLEGLVKVG